MHTTTSTASTASSALVGRHWKTIRRGATVAALAAVFAAGAPADSLGASPPVAEGPVGCAVTPTANSLAFDVSALLGTIRERNGTFEMLHDAVCLDGHVGTVWLVADFG
jgi:hypothetical protein